MKKRKSDKYWIPFWCDKWLFGSLRLEFTHEERAIWMDFIALASKDDGYIRANEDLGYPIMQLAGLLMIPMVDLEKVIKKFVDKEKITATLDSEKNHIYYILTWEKYQFTDRYKRKIEADSSEKSEQRSPKKEVYNIIKNNKIKYNTKELSNIDTEKYFDNLRSAFPSHRRGKRDYCFRKFNALVKAGKLEEFRKTTIGYFEYLKHKKLNENFEQEAMGLSTWMNNWEGDKGMYIDFVYKPRL